MFHKDLSGKILSGDGKFCLERRKTFLLNGCFNRLNNTEVSSAPAAGQRSRSYTIYYYGKFPEVCDAPSCHRFFMVPADMIRLDT